MPELGTFPHTIIVEGASITVAADADLLRHKHWSASQVERLQRLRRGDRSILR